MELAASKGTRAKWIAVYSYIASVLLFLLAISTENIRIKTQSNGAAEIQYFLVSLFAVSGALGVLFFAITISLAILQRRTAIPWRSILGSGLLSAGFLATLLAVFIYAVNLEDTAPRCLDGCAPSMQQYLQELFVMSTVLAVLGLLAAGFGAYLLMRRVT